MNHKREESGLQILAKGNIHCINKSEYIVKSQSNPKKEYKVEWLKNHWQCSCPDFQQRKKKCKHIYAIIYTQTVEDIRSGLNNYKNQNLCPICKTNEQVIKRGKRNNQSGSVQLYFCKKCNQRFTGRPGFQKMKHNALIISAGLDLYFKGLSLRAIQEHLQITYKEHVSHVTVYNWLKRYVSIISKYVDKLNVSSTRWNIDETIINVKGRHMRVWNVIDADTRFLICCHISTNRNAQDAGDTIIKARKKCKNTPWEITTDGLESYNHAIKNRLKPTIENPIVHLQGPLKMALNNKIERFNGTIKNRTKTMGCFQNKNTLQNFIDGFTIYYNYIRPNIGIEKKTPAESIGISNKKKSWLDLIFKSNNP